MAVGFHCVHCSAKTNHRRQNMYKIKKYPLRSNFKFVFAPVWKEKRTYIRDMIIGIILSVIVPVTGSMLSALVVGLLGENLSAVTVIAAILSAFLGYALVNAADTYIRQKHVYHHIEVRVQLFTRQFTRKICEIPQEQYEAPELKLLREKASVAVSNNNAGVEGFLRAVSAFGTGLLGLFVYMAIAGLIHPIILVLLFVLSVIGALCNSLPDWYENKIRDENAKDEMTMQYIDRLNDDAVSGKDIRVFGLKNWIIGKYGNAIRNTRRRNAKKNSIAFAGKALETVLTAGRDLICYLYLIGQLKNGMSLTMFVFYLGIIGGFSAWFSQVSDSFAKMKYCNVHITDFRNFLDLGEKERKKKIPQNQFKTVEVVFDHVTFCYKGAEKPVLNDISFSLKSGEHKALVGLNGAGKSTLVKLISGLYLPTKGTIYVNGIDTRELDMETYYEHEAAVFQDTFTLTYSVAENVALSEQWEEQKVWECLEKAGLMQKVKALPQGLSTNLGKELSQDGVKLSGGETQKLLLARALYRDPSIILLDEPTAALDALAESEIYEIYNHTLADITALFISHRLASTRFCEEILLLSDGKIAECGSHEELMEQKGKYYELFLVQSKYYGKEGAEDVG